MNINKVGIIGCGVMGAGIAQVILQAGCEVIVCESKTELLERGLGKLRSIFGMLVEKDKLSATQRDDILRRLSGIASLEAMTSLDLIVEAVFEDLQTKLDVFRTLDAVCGNETIFASNTSSMSITRMASATKRPDRFVGLHFFNPVPFMPLVEVVKTISTDQSVIELTVDFVKHIGKVPVLAKDDAGFIVNALTTPFLLDAMKAVSEGKASVQDIDTAMKLGMNHPLGPLMLSDLIGLDVLLKGSQNMYDESQDHRYIPPPVLKKMVMLNLLGKKVKKGFYDWSDPKNPTPSDLSL